MSPSQLDKIVSEAPDEVASILSELKPRIIEAAAATLEETQDSDAATAKVKVALSLSIDLSMSPPSWSIDGSVGVRYKVKGEAHDTEETPELAPNLGKGRKGKEP